MDSQGGLNGIALTQAALEAEIGRFGNIFVAVAILLFAYSSIIGNYYYGEANIRFLTRNARSASCRKWVMAVYRLLAGGVVVIFGALASLDLVWSLGDLCMALLTACNLYAIARLGKYAFRLLDDYRAQKKAGKNPVFRRDSLPETAELDLECWE